MKTYRQACICLTPLHVLIARRIAEDVGDAYELGIFMTSTDNEKSRYYAASMKDFCAEVRYVIVPNDDYPKPKYFHIWLRRTRHFLSFIHIGKIDTVFAPSSINQYLYAFLSAIRFVSLITYDDGIANVLPNAPLRDFFNRKSWKLFLLSSGLRFWPERIRSTANMHYSIYNAENFSLRVRRITLVRDAPTCHEGAESCRSIRILLGTAPESPPVVHDIMQQAASRINPDWYLPHPRNKDRPFPYVPVLDTPLVAEDYVAGAIKDRQDINVQLFGYDSSALLNLANTPRVTAFSFLKDCSIDSRLHDVMKKAGVRFFDLHTSDDSCSETKAGQVAARDGRNPDWLSG